MSGKNAVGIRSLRQNLSKYLRNVEEGESFQVSDRGRPVALLSRYRSIPPLGNGLKLRDTLFLLGWTYRSYYQLPSPFRQTNPSAMLCRSSDRKSRGGGRRFPRPRNPSLSGFHTSGFSPIPWDIVGLHDFLRPHIGRGGEGTGIFGAGPGVIADRCLRCLASFDDLNQESIPAGLIRQTAQTFNARVASVIGPFS